MIAGKGMEACVFCEARSEDYLRVRKQADKELEEKDNQIKELQKWQDIQTRTIQDRDKLIDNHIAKVWDEQYAIDIADMLNRKYCS